MNTQINALHNPIYMLYYIDDVYNGSIFSEFFEEKFREDYSKKIISEIKKSIKWALDNPDHNFQKLLPNVNYSNKDILYFLEKYSEKIQSR